MKTIEEEQYVLPVKKQKSLAVQLILCALLLMGCNGKAQQSSANAKAESQTAATDAKLINPGLSIGALQIDDTRERALELLGKPGEEYNYDGKFTPCIYAEMHWYDFEQSSNGIFAYLKDGRIFQIEAATPRYVSVNGITSGSSPEQVRAHHPQLQAYALLHSGAKVNGGRNLIYWVDRQKGIAFEFYYDRRVDARRVARIIVFAPGTEFLQKGCVTSPREWRELEPFSLESPSGEEQKLER